MTSRTILTVILCCLLLGTLIWVKQTEIDADQNTTVHSTIKQGSAVSTTKTKTISYDTGSGTLMLNIHGMLDFIGISGVEVFIDDEKIGSTNAFNPNSYTGIPVGTHSLRLSMNGYKDWIKQISISAYRITLVYATMEEGTGISTTRNETIFCDTNFGNLHLVTRRSGEDDVNEIRVLVDDEFVGETIWGFATSPDSYEGIPVGTYSLRLSKSGYKDWIKQISINAGQNTTVYAEIEEGSGVSTTRAETISYYTPFGALDLFARDRFYEPIGDILVFTDG